MSYGCISGNDFYAEVIVGRFSGSTPAQIATQVERSIEYERYPQTGVGTEWYDNALGVASNQGPGFGGYTDDDFNEFVEFLDNIKLYTTSINYIFFSKLIKEICLYCNKIIPGLYNLKETYENISKIKAKIDSIIMILIDFKAEMAVLRKRQKAIYSKVKRF